MRKKIWRVLKDLEKENINTNEAYEILCDLHNVSKSEVFEHYGKPFTSGRDLWDFLTENYNFTKKT